MNPKPNHDIGVEHQVMDRVQAALMIVPKRVVEHCVTIIPEQIVISDFFRQSSFGSRLGCDAGLQRGLVIWWVR